MTAEQWTVLALLLTGCCSDDGRMKGGNEDIDKVLESADGSKRRNWSYDVDDRLRRSRYIRRRRSDPDPNVWVKPNQYSSGAFEIDATACAMHGDKRIANDFAAESATVTISSLTSKCQIRFNSASQARESTSEGFVVSGDLSNGNQMYELSDGIDFTPTSDKRVKNDLVLEFTKPNPKLIITGVVNCKDATAFNCHDFCISQFAMCDGVKNCPDGADEMEWRCGGLGNSKLLTFLVFLCIGALVAIILVPIKIVRRRRRHRQTSAITISNRSSNNSRIRYEKDRGSSSTHSAASGFNSSANLCQPSTSDVSHRGNNNNAHADSGRKNARRQSHDDLMQQFLRTATFGYWKENKED